MAESEPLIPKHGGYRRLKTFQIAQLIYDVTVRFCDRYVDKKSRTQPNCRIWASPFSAPRVFLSPFLSFLQA